MYVTLRVYEFQDIISLFLCSFILFIKSLITYEQIHLFLPGLSGLGKRRDFNFCYSNEFSTTALGHDSPKWPEPRQKLSKISQTTDASPTTVFTTFVFS